MDMQKAELPLVSVLINTYNYGRFIEECIERVLLQEFPQNAVEIIVVDDGSTDDTNKRIQKYLPRIRYIYSENQGQASAYNIGAQQSQGKVICFLDSDDYWHPHKLRSVVDTFDSDEHIDVVYHRLTVVDESRQELGRTPPDNVSTACRLLSGEQILRSLGSSSPPSSAICVRSACLKQILPVPRQLRIMADSYLHFFLPLHCHTVAMLSESLGIYRIHENNRFGVNPLLGGPSRIRKIKEMRQALRSVAATHPSMNEHLHRLQLEAIESELSRIDIALDNLEGKKMLALTKALTTRPFPPDSSLSKKIKDKVALLLFALLPARVFERLRAGLRRLFPKRLA